MSKRKDRYVVGFASPGTFIMGDIYKPPLENSVLPTTKDRALKLADLRNLRVVYELVPLKEKKKCPKK